MGSNHSAPTTSPIPVYPNHGPPMQGYPPQAGPQYYPQVPQGRPAPRCRSAPPRSGGPRRTYQGDPYGSYGPSPNNFPPAAANPDIFSRHNRPTVQDILDYADDDFADDRDVFGPQQQQSRNPPFGQFDPFQRYNQRRADGAGPSILSGPSLVSQDAIRYRNQPPAPKTYHFTPPVGGGPSEHVFHYDPSTGDLAHSSGQPLTQVAFNPYQQGGSYTNPNGGVVFPPRNQMSYY